MGMTAIVQQEMREKKLVGSKCSRCGNISYPPMIVCPACGPAFSKDVKPVELPSVGTVVTWTQLQVAPKGFPSPVLHCVVDLGGMKIIGTVQGTSEIKRGETVGISLDPTGRFPFVFTRVAEPAKPK